MLKPGDDRNSFVESLRHILQTIVSGFSGVWKTWKSQRIKFEVRENLDSQGIFQHSYCFCSFCVCTYTR